MQDNLLAGLYLPLKVLVYQEADGRVFLVYDDPVATLTELDGVTDDAVYLARMRGALAALTGKAAGR